jgi:hypothetical protein
MTPRWVLHASFPLTAIALLALGCHAAPLKIGRPDAAATGAPDAAATSVTPAGPTIIASGQASPTKLAFDDGNLYWLNLGVYYENGDLRVWWWNGAQVMKCPKSGCPNGPTAMVSGRRQTMNQSINFATDGEYVYWSDDGPDVFWDGGGTGGGLLRCSVAGCNNTPELLSDHPALSLAVADGSLYVIPPYSCQLEACLTSGCATPPNLLWSNDSGTTLTAGQAVAADARDVYWTTMSMVMRCARGGCNGDPTILVSRADVVWGLGPIALDTSNVYFGHDNSYESGQRRDGEILACAKTGCAGSPRLVGPSPEGPSSLATDGINVYWTERDTSLSYGTTNDGLLRKCPVAGCGDGPTTMASGFGRPSTVAVDGDYVYWTDAGASRQGGYGRIWRAPK